MTTKQKRPKPGPYHREVMLDKPPVMQLDLYDHVVMLTRRDRDSWATYPVSPLQVAQVLGRLPITSGLLPEHTIATGMQAGEPFFVIYIPPRVVTVQIARGTGKSAQTLLMTIPLPPLVWSGGGAKYQIFALGTVGYPTRPDTPLFLAPFPNVYPNGGICWGSSDARPRASAETILRVLHLFLSETQFSGHLANGKSRAYPGSVITRFAELEGAEHYPLDDLVTATPLLADLLRGGA